MFTSTDQKAIAQEIADIKTAGMFKEEKEIIERDGAVIYVGKKKLLNFCANDYLGLTQDRRVKKTAAKGLKEWGLGMSSVRFICGTTTLDIQLEKAISGFLRTEDTILYGSCFDANAGLFEVLLKEGDAVFSDELNHASIIDGIRLCKAERFRYAHANMTELEKQLMGAKNVRRRLIVTDGVFSMDGDIAPLRELVALAAKYDALLMVDDSHASGVLGKTGRGSGEARGVLGKVDIITSTLGKAFGAGGGGFTTGYKDIITLLRQRSRTYLFSKTITPAVTHAAHFVVSNFDKVFLRQKEKLLENAAYFRKKLAAFGFTLGGVLEHPITPIMLLDEQKTIAMASALFDEGVYVRGFTYPVVPKGKARIRVQLSAQHSRKDLDKALSAMEKAGKKLSII